MQGNLLPFFEDKIKETNKLIFYLFAFLNKLISLGLCYDWNHLRPAMEFFINPHGKKIDECHKLFCLFDICRHIDFRKWLKLNIKHFLFSWNYLDFFLGLFRNWFGRSIGLWFFWGENSSENSLLFLGFFDDRDLLDNDLFFIPASEILNELQMWWLKIVVKEIVLASIFDSLKNVVLIVQVITGLNVAFSVVQG